VLALVESLVFSFKGSLFRDSSCALSPTRSLDGLIFYNGNTFVPVLPIYLPANYTLGALYVNGDVQNTLLLDCLIGKESRNDPKALGDSGRARGILQMWRSFFHDFCVVKYGLASSTSEIWDEEIQIRCADRAIEDGYGYKWTTLSKCLWKLK